MQINFPKWVVVLVAVAAAIFIYTQLHQSSESCMVINTGNKVCGEAAKAWCSTTQPDRDSLREQLGYDAESTRLQGQLDSTDADCKALSD